MSTRDRLEELNEEIADTRSVLLTLQAERGKIEAGPPPTRKHPMQRVYVNEHDVVRFTENKIVVFLLDNGGHDMNDLACRDFSQEDREQFAQLIGYSVSGFGSLSYASDEAVAEADAAQRLLLPPAADVHVAAFDVPPSPGSIVAVSVPQGMEARVSLVPAAEAAAPAGEVE